MLYYTLCAFWCELNHDPLRNWHTSILMYQFELQMRMNSHQVLWIFNWYLNCFQKTSWEQIGMCMMLISTTHTVMKYEFYFFCTVTASSSEFWLKKISQTILQVLAILVSLPENMSKNEHIEDINLNRAPYFVSGQFSCGWEIIDWKFTHNETPK